MRIVLDMQGAQTDSRFRGIGRYSLALAKAIVRQAGGHDVWIAANAQLSPGEDALIADFAGLLPAHRVRRFDVPSPVAWSGEGGGWRRSAAECLRESFLRDLQPDIVHVSSLFEGTNDHAVTSIGRLGQAVPTSVTLYDLIPWFNQDMYLSSAWARDWYMSKIASLRKAHPILAISAYARQEAIDALGIDAASIVNISAAASPLFRPADLDDEERLALLARFDIRRPFLMYSGAMDHRKNVDGLVAAFGLLPEELRSEHELLIAGHVDPRERERVLRVAAKAGVERNLRFTGYLDDRDLVGLYSLTALYVFPSLHEGFGLPALEAMCCGAPTIGSSTTSVPEVIGREDALFDPTSPASIAQRITRVLSDDDFARSLREHARAQSARFSWDASARRALEAFEASHERNRAVDRSWAAVQRDVERHHGELIQAVAALPHDGAPEKADLVQVAAAISGNRDEALDAARGAEPLPDSLVWRLEGPFDSSYSLALVNRELALALSGRGNDIALHSTEGPGDFPASPAFLAAHHEIARLHENALDLPQDMVDVASRLIYPPRVDDMRARYNLLHAYPWEESGFPDEWVEAFNDHLQGIGVVSTHVEKVLVDAGVRVPIAVTGNGTDHWERVESGSCPTLPSARFRFLHVSSCFPRKGADAMLRAYGQAFAATDDVCLVIKTFANPHNEIRAWLAEAKEGRADFPAVHIIEQDIDESSLKALYEACDVLVAPSRAEGFGLPMAEAMMSGLGVITTSWGGQLDFCRDDTAWLVDYRFEEARTHFGLFHSVWAEPDVEALARIMRDVHGLTAVERSIKVQRAQALLRSTHTWADVAARTEAFVRQVASMPRARPPKIGWVSTWNKRCGIASYSEHLVGNMPGDVTVFAAETAQRTAEDGPEVVRCWDQDQPDDLERLAAAIDTEGCDAIVLQFQYGFYHFGPLADFLVGQHAAGRSVIVMMHATQDPPHAPDRKLSTLVDALAVCDRVFVHGVGDLNRLKALGLVHNVAIIPHGIVDTPDMVRRTATTGRFVLASYGFFLPHKGLPELVEAVSLLSTQGVDVELRMINAEYHVGESRDMIARTRALVAAKGLSDRVTLVTEYLADEDSLARLQDADLIVFPYQGTGESSSAAVRYGLASGRPVAVTPISIFDDVGGAVHRLPGTSPADLARGIGMLVTDARRGGEARRAVEDIAQRWRAAHRYSYLGRRLYNTVRYLSGRRKAPESAQDAV